MDNQSQINQVSTKATDEAKSGVFLTEKEAEEYYAYKKRKKITEITLALSRSEGTVFNGEDTRRICERALCLKQAAVKTPPSKVAEAKTYLMGGFTRVDCVVGGNGETLTKIKAYEAKLAVKKGAKEITVPVTPSLFDACRYTEIRKELKRVKRAVKNALFKVRVEKIHSISALSRVARIASEIGARYFSVPYFEGCERLRLDLTNGCLLEVTGVEQTKTFQYLTEKGVERIVTDKAWDIYNDWIRETREIPCLERNVGFNATKILALSKFAKEEIAKDEPTKNGKEKLDIKLL